MPNGGDKSLIRILAAIDGFRSHHGVWPNRLRISSSVYDLLHRHLLTPESFRQFQSKMQIIREPERYPEDIVAEDDQGRRYRYGIDRHRDRPDVCSRDWLEVELQPGASD